MVARASSQNIHEAVAPAARNRIPKRENHEILVIQDVSNQLPSALLETLLWISAKENHLPAHFAAGNCDF
jgi:hypothetical protein